MALVEESDRLDSIASKSAYGDGANRAMIAYSFKVFSRFIQSGPLLELGPAEGHMTDQLMTLGLPTTVVEGAESFCIDLKQRHPAATVVHALFEDYRPAGQFDTIVMGHVLEHVEDPVDILRRCREWLTERGRILAAVPNAHSLHRQAGVLMGMLETENQMNDNDRRHGHRRVYNGEEVRRDFVRAGLTIETSGGYWLKPVSNAQTERDWSPEMLEAYMVLGERYPEIAGEIYVVARR